jgi:hypothetical protein
MVWVGCGAESTPGVTEEPLAEGCDACADGEVCMVYFEDDGTNREECAMLPAECAGDSSCECRGPMYSLCEDPFYGVACSDTFPPTLVSCNL